MVCANKQCQRAEKLQLPPAVYTMASELISTCYSLVSCGLNTLPDDYTAADLLVILQALVRENADLKTKIDDTTGPAVSLQNCGVHFEFGPHNAYTLDIAVPPAHAAEFAAQLTEIAQKLKRRVAAKKMQANGQQMSLPFSDCA